jgi:phage shock protein C
MSDRLYRSRQDRMLAGVAGGLAEMWDADPSLVRIVWALLAVFTGGIALVVYIVMAIVVPEEDALPWPPVVDPSTGTAGQPSIGAAEAAGATAAAGAGSGWVDPHATRRGARPARRGRRAARRSGNSSVPVVLGGLLIVLGGFFLAREFIPELDFDWFWPAVLIALGIFLLVTALGRGRDDHSGAGGAS